MCAIVTKAAKNFRLRRAGNYIYYIYIYRQKTYQKWALCQIVSTRYLQIECEFRSSSEDRSSHCNSFANTTFISITSHYWRSPAVPDGSCKTSSEQCVSLWSYLIPLSGSLPGHHFRPWRCWGAD